MERAQRENNTPRMPQVIHTWFLKACKDRLPEARPPRTDELDELWKLVGQDPAALGDLLIVAQQHNRKTPVKFVGGYLKLVLQQSALDVIHSEARNIIGRRLVLEHLDSDFLDRLLRGQWLVRNQAAWPPEYVPGWEVDHRPGPTAEPSTEEAYPWFADVFQGVFPDASILTRDEFEQLFELVHGDIDALLDAMHSISAFEYIEGQADVFSRVRDRLEAPKSESHRARTQDAIAKRYARDPESVIGTPRSDECKTDNANNSLVTDSSQHVDNEQVHTDSSSSCPRETGARVLIQAETAAGPENGSAAIPVHADVALARVEESIDEARQQTAVTSISEDASGPLIEFEILAQEGFSDHRVADLLIKRHGQDLRYVPEVGRWLAWDGRRWVNEPDTAQVEQRVIALTQALIDSLPEIVENLELRSKLHAQALRLESNARVTGIVRRASALAAARVAVEAFDAEPFLLNVANGTLDLRTGKLRENRREDQLTQMIEVPYDPAAEAPGFHTFLETIFAGDQELIRYVQRAVGYSITGETSERALFMLHGTGRNGKSVFMEALKQVLDEYMAPVSVEALLKHRERQHPADLAALRGKRLAYAQEPPEGRRLDEALVKSLTGGDTITVRRMHENPWELRPTFKIWLSTNYKPPVSETGLAIWDRIKLIPFPVTIQEDQVVPRRDLLAVFREEAPGILRWAVEGCLAYLKHGLDEPAVVREAVEKYRQEMDTLVQFLAACCEVMPGREEWVVTPNDLYEVYWNWCQYTGEEALPSQAFGRKLTERGLPLKSKRDDGGVRRVRVGIRLRGESTWQAAA